MQRGACREVLFSFASVLILSAWFSMCSGRCFAISVLNWRYTGPTCCVLSTCVFLSTCFVLSTLLCSLHMLCSLHIAWFSHVDFSLHVFSSLHMMCQQRHLFYWRFEGESHNASWHSSSCIADHWFPWPHFFSIISVVQWGSFQGSCQVKRGRETDTLIQ